MSKAAMISIQPKWCELIANGKKTIEVRKTKPKLETPFKVYIYCTYGQGLIENNDLCYPNMLLDEKVSKNAIWGNCCNGKVIGEFICENITDCRDIHGQAFFTLSCMSLKEWMKYTEGHKGTVWAWHISDLVIYDKPRELSEFCTVDIKAVRSCEDRKQTYHQFTDTGYIKNGFYCVGTDDWCTKCKRKPITRPPQSWCYVEGGENDG